MTLHVQLTFTELMHQLMGALDVGMITDLSLKMDLTTGMMEINFDSDVDSFSFPVKKSEAKSEPKTGLGNI